MSLDNWSTANKSKFIFASVWDEIRVHESTDDSCRLIWHNVIARKFSFTTYMAYMHRLSTADRLKAWGIAINLLCELCKCYDELHQHIFTNCSYSTYLWSKLFNKLLLQPRPAMTLEQLFSTLRQAFTSKLAS